MSIYVSHKSGVSFFRSIVFWLLLGISFGIISFPLCAAGGDNQDRPLALINGILIDGTGAAPVPNAALVIRDGKIIAAGSMIEGASQISIPDDAGVIDLNRATILPGFVNAHVHRAFDLHKLTVWAQAGVTTVRDLSAGGESSVADLVTLRNSWRGIPEYARLVTVGPMITVPGGYGFMYVNSPNEARQKINKILDIGVDLIKISMEDGYAGVSGLPKFTTEELAAIVDTVHKRGTLVTAHVTQAKYLEKVVNAGVDEAAHNCYNAIPDSVIQQMVKKGVYMVPTFTVYRNYDVLKSTFDNLKRFVKAGGRVAIGNDYGGGPGEFELGMPMCEIECMQKSGMTPMEIIVAGTKNGAHVCHMEKELGTLEVGKIADILVVNGNPLKDLNSLRNVRLVVHNGVIIRDEKPE